MIGTVDRRYRQAVSKHRPPPNLTVSVQVYTVHFAKLESFCTNKTQPRLVSLCMSSITGSQERNVCNAIIRPDVNCVIKHQKGPLHDAYRKN